MTDTRRLIERVGEGAPFPDDAFERMLSRRDRKQRNQRIAAGAVGIAVFVAAIAFALGGNPWSTVDTPVPRDLPPDTGVVTFWFDFDGIPPSHDRVTVNGVPIEGTMTNGPQHAYAYRWDPAVEVPAGSSIVVEEAGVTGEITGWINAEGPPGSPHLYELDLAAGTASMPTEPGNYIVEIHVPDPPGGAYFTDLFPVRVVAPSG